MFPKYYILKSILLNTKIKDNEKIKLFDKFSEDEINLKDLEKLNPKKEKIKFPCQFTNGLAEHSAR